MASALFSPAASAHPKSISLSTAKPIIQSHLISLIDRPRRISVRCNVFPENITEVLSDNFDSLPIIGSGSVEIQKIADALPESEKWGIAASAGLGWIYLTARPGVLIGAIDAYILAPLQLVLDSLTGKRGLKRSDFLITDKLGEGSFGTVYSGLVVPKGVNVEKSVPKRSLAKILESDKRFKDRVILKQVFYRTFC